jgi:small subunit ribosomal protein S18
MAKFIRRTKRTIRKPSVCYVCKQKLEPDYKDLENIKRYISDRGKIVGRMQSGVCQKHQKMLSTAVKRARYLGLIPFIVRPE